MSVRMQSGPRTKGKKLLVTEGIATGNKGRYYVVTLGHLQPNGNGLLDGDYDAAVKCCSSLEAQDISGHTGDILCDWKV